MYFDDRGFGDKLETLIEMCHFLIHHNFAVIINPFELPIAQLKKHYEFQNLIIRNKLRTELKKDLSILNVEHGDAKGCIEFENLLSKRDNL